jgi:hypothetical protein
MEHVGELQAEFKRMATLLVRLQAEERKKPCRQKQGSVFHPPQSPDVAPCDFFLFPRIK